MAQSPFVGPARDGDGRRCGGGGDDGTALWTNPAGFARDPRLDVEMLAGGVATNRNDFTATVDRLSHRSTSRQARPRRHRRGRHGPEEARRSPAPASSARESRGSSSGSGAGRSESETSRTPASIRASISSVSCPATIRRPVSSTTKRAVVRRARGARGAARLRDVVLREGRSSSERRPATSEGRPTSRARASSTWRSSDPASSRPEGAEGKPAATDKPFAFDVGERWSTSSARSRVGLVSTAINEPEFDVARDPAVRASPAPRVDPAPADAAGRRRRGAGRPPDRRRRLRPARDGHLRAGGQEPAVLLGAPS